MAYLQPAEPDLLLHVLLALATVVALGRILSAAFSWIGQPAVIGEVVAGILLGPSLLGSVAPQTAGFLLPASVAPYLGILAQLGVILYMFVVGLELNLGALRGRGRATLFISSASILVPFILGVVLARGLFARLGGEGVSLASFALFLGVALSVTAFPVLARILSDRGMTRTALGTLSLTCAAVNDVTAWCLLAVAVGVARAEVQSAFWVILLACGYGLIMFTVIRPLARRYSREGDDPDHVPTALLATTFVALLISASITELIGIHAIFGAFLLGAVIPHDSAVARSLTGKLEEVVTILLLPAFFAFTGMRTQIGLVAGMENWLICGLITLAATVGKIGGTALAARLTGYNWRTATGLGFLMNTRGLMELIVLNVGLDLGVISPTVFAMLVIMALATTLATTPAMHLLGVEKHSSLKPVEATD